MAEPMRQQWLHGFLELCLLSLIAERSDYGIGLAERLAAVGFPEVPGGTLYPSLLRLEKQGLARTHKQPSTSGPARKYYELTEQGTAVLAERARAWGEFRSAMDAVVGLTHPIEGAR